MFENLIEMLCGRDGTFGSIVAGFFLICFVIAILGLLNAWAGGSNDNFKL